MTAQTPEDPIEANPMMRVLRERHPEVDVVLLPQRAVPAVVGASATAEVLAQITQETEFLLDALVERLSRDPAWPGDPVRDSRWRLDQVAGDHDVLARREVVLTAANLPEGDNVALLRGVGNALLGLGWQVRPVVGDRPRLVARRGAFSAASTIRESSLHVTVTSTPVRAVAEDVR